MLTEQEKKELKELVAKKKAKTLTETEAARLEELNKKCGFKGKKKDPKKKDTKKGFVPGNDFSWWSKVPELLRDAANFKCNYVAGDRIAGNDIPFVVPGVLAVKMKSVYGCDAKATDPINVWARDLYLKMFHNYRPASGYSASDLAIAVLAAIEAVKVIAKYERIYGIINRYSRLNINMPLVEASALGLSASTVSYLQGHMSDFRYDLNFLIRKAQRLCVPKDISALADAISLFGYEYLDHENARAQIIMFDSDEFGVYSDTALSSGGSISFNEFTASNLFDFTGDNMCTALSDVLDALLGSDSIQRIYADMVVWFGQDAMLAFVPIPEDYIVAPAYSESMLHKLHNLECINGDYTSKLTSWASDLLSDNDRDIVLNGNYHIYQVNDIVVTRGALTGTGAAEPIIYKNGKILASTSTDIINNTTCHLLDTYRVDPDAEVITEGVMYKYDSEVLNGDATARSAVLTSAAFYLVSHIQLWSNSAQDLEDPTYIELTNLIYDDEETAKISAGSLACIDWAPLVYDLGDASAADDNNVFKINHIYGDMDQVIPMYHNDIARLQRTIVLSGLHTEVKSVR